MTRPRYEDFRSTDEYDPDVVEAMIETRRESRVYAPTGLDDEQYLAVHRIIPPELKSDKVIYRATAWSDDPNRPDSELFDAYLALDTGMEVVEVANPGVESNRWADPEYNGLTELTPEQIADLKDGRFRMVGRGVANALLHEGYGADEKPIIVATSSMGTAVGGAVVGEGAQKGMKFSGMVAAEMVNHHRWTLRRNGDPSVAALGSQFMLQGRNAPNYVAMNPPGIDTPEPFGEFIGRVREDFQANKLYVSAMTHGALWLDMLPGIEALEDQPVIISRGAGSTLSPEGAFEKMKDLLLPVRYLQSRTIGDAKTNPHQHPYTMTKEQVRRDINEIS